jgi:hypothetical protein
MKIDANKYYNVKFKDIEDRICDINLKGSELLNKIIHFLNKTYLVSVSFGFNRIIFNYITPVSINKVIVYYKEV